MPFNLECSAISSKEIGFARSRINTAYKDSKYATN